MSKAAHGRHVWHDAAEVVGGELREIHALAAVMRGQLQMIASSTESAAFDIAERLQALDEALSADCSKEQMSCMVMDSLASMQFQDIVRQQTDAVIDALGRMEGHAEALAERLARFDDQAFSFKPLAQHLDELFANYVMPAQRETHVAALRAIGRPVGAVPDDPAQRAPAAAVAPGRAELF